MSSFRRVLKAFLTDTWCNHNLEIIEEWYVWWDPIFAVEILSKDGENPPEGKGRFRLTGKVYHQLCSQCQEIIKTKVT